jgi:formylglycine-generating enzyme required for sulfatase activity
MQEDIWKRTNDEMRMLFVPAGTFQMGSDKNETAVTPAELPNHEVSLDGFWIDQTEISNAQYNQCVNAGICRESQYATNPSYNGDGFPVVGIAWDDALDYCDWVGGRLPTEAEWEYAAKGQSGGIYPWGNDFNGTLANFCDANCNENWADPNFDDGYRQSAPTGRFPGGASWVGALDMAGNVWEWTWDWCAGYSSDSQINPQGPDEGICKIIRGGAWTSPSDGIRTTYRMMSSEIRPDIRHSNIGFRCVVPGNQQSEGKAAISSDPIVVPSWNPAIIDGTHSPGEWNQATTEIFADGSQLFLMQAEGYLYLGIRTNEPRSFAGNVYIQSGNEINILHSSAALGTAIYRKAEDGWQQIQNFNWQLRSTSNSESALAERAAFLHEEGWLAANGLMGTPTELEYQIKIPEQDFRIAVVFTKSSPPYEKIPWPSQLTDETTKPTPNGFPEILYFSPEQWAKLALDI